MEVFLPLLGRRSRAGIDLVVRIFHFRDWEAKRTFIHCACLFLQHRLDRLQCRTKGRVRWQQLLFHA